MKLLKMLCLAVIGALAITAFGASSASANSTLFCTKHTASLTPTLVECVPPLNVHFLSVKVILHAGGIELSVDEKGTSLNSTLNTKCDVLFSGHVLNLDLVTNGPVVIHSTANELVYSNCTFGCTVTTVTGGLALLLKLPLSGPELGDATGHEFEIRVNCFGFFDCYYNWAGLVGHFLGPLNADTGGKGHITYSENTLTLVKGSSCPATTKLDVLLQSLTPLYLRS